MNGFLFFVSLLIVCWGWSYLLDMETDFNYQPKDVDVAGTNSESDDVTIEQD